MVKKFSMSQITIALKVQGSQKSLKTRFDPSYHDIWILMTIQATSLPRLGLISYV